MIKTRILRTALVLLALPVIVLLLAFGVWMTVVATAVAFSGSTSMPSAPAGTGSVLGFISGAVAAGWLAALLLAVSPLQQIPSIPVVLAAATGGTVAALVPSLAKQLLAVGIQALQLLGPFLAYK